MTMDICESMFKMNSLFQTWWIPNPNVLKSKELETCMKQKKTIFTYHACIMRKHLNTASTEIEQL